MNRHIAKPRAPLSILFALCLGACATGLQSAGSNAREITAPLPNGAVLAQRGLTSLERGDTVRAEQYLKLAVRAGYPEELVILPLLKACVASSRLRSALSHAEPYLRRNPHAFRVRYLAAAAYLALGQPARAFNHLARVVAQRPDVAQAHYLMGHLLRDSFGDEQGAREAFRAYLAQAPRGEHAAELLAYLNDEADATEPAP